MATFKFTTLDSDCITDDGKIGVAEPDLNVPILAKEVFYQATPNLITEQVATIIRDPGVIPGKTISFLRYRNLVMGGQLDDSCHDIPVEDIATDKVEITVHPQGGGVGFSEYDLRLAADDLLTRGAELLGARYATVRDKQGIDTLLTASTTLYQGGAASRDALTPDDTITVDDMRMVWRELARKDAIQFDNKYFVAIMHPDVAYYLKGDPTYRQDMRYAQPMSLLRGEFGTVEGIICVTSTQIEPVVDSGGLRIYPTIIVGANAVGLAVALDVAVKFNALPNFGLIVALAWYGIWGWGIINDDHIVILETAA